MSLILDFTTPKRVASATCVIGGRQYSYFSSGLASVEHYSAPQSETFFYITAAVWQIMLIFAVAGFFFWFFFFFFF
jgi:hypothetical protein